MKKRRDIRAELGRSRDVASSPKPRSSHGERPTASTPQPRQKRLEPLQKEVPDFNSPDRALTVLENTSPRCFAATRAVHMHTGEVARSNVLEHRRKNGMRELTDIMGKLFPTVQTDDVVTDSVKRAGNGLAVPSLSALVDKMIEERAAQGAVDLLRRKRGPSNDSSVNEHFANQVRWLIQELRVAKEANEILEERYRLLLGQCAEKDEVAFRAEQRRHEAEDSKEDAFKLLSEERKKAEETRSTLTWEVQNARQKLMAALEAQAKGQNAATAAAKAEAPSPSPTPVARVHEVARATTDDAGSGGVSFEEKEALLRQLVELRGVVDEKTKELSLAQDKLAIATASAERHKLTIATVKRNASCEVETFKQMLSEVRDVHERETAELEKQYSHAVAQATKFETAMHEMHHQLEEVTQRMVAMQQTLMSGPSVQSLLHSAQVKADDASRVHEELNRMSDMVTNFASQMDAKAGKGAVDADHLLRMARQRDAQEQAEREAVVAQQRVDAARREQVELQASKQSPPTNVVQEEGSVPTILVPEIAPHVATKAHPTSVAVETQTTFDVVTVACQYDSEYDSELSASEAEESLASSRSGLEESDDDASSDETPPSGTESVASSKPSSVHEPLPDEQLPAVKSSTKTPVTEDSPANPDATGPTPSDDRAPEAPVTVGQITASEKESKPTHTARSRAVNAVRDVRKHRSNPSQKRSNAPAKAADNTHPPERDVKKKTTSTRPRRGDSESKPQEVRTAPSAAGPSPADATGLPKAPAASSEAKSDAAEGASSATMPEAAPSTAVSKAQLASMLAASRDETIVMEEMERLRNAKDRAEVALQEVRANFDAERRTAELNRARITELEGQVSVLTEEAHRLEAELSTAVKERAQSRDLVQSLNASVRQLETDCAFKEEQHNSEIKALHQDIVQLRQENRALSLSDARAKLGRKEKVFFEAAERILRCIMSTKATASCPCCLEIIREPVVLVPCGHVMCAECFRESNQQQGLAVLGTGRNLTFSSVTCVPLSESSESVTQSRSSVIVTSPQLTDANRHLHEKLRTASASGGLSSPERAEALAYTATQMLHSVNKVAGWYCEECATFTVTRTVPGDRIEELIDNVRFVQRNIDDIRTHVVSAKSVIEGPDAAAVTMADSSAHAQPSGANAGTDLEADAEAFLIDEVS